MAGVPLLNGFLSKEMFFAEAADWHNGTWLDNALPYMATLASVFSIAYSLRFIMTVFFGPPATSGTRDALVEQHGMKTLGIKQLAMIRLAA